MNLWTAKLGSSCFSKNDISSINTLLAKYPIFKDGVLFEYQNANLHYVSISSDQDFVKKTYNFIDENNNLNAFSGLLIGITGLEIDMRQAKNISMNNIFDIYSKAIGQYSLIRAGNNSFECIVDPLGNYKVYYFKSLKDNLIYVSNYLPLISLFNTLNNNYDYLVEFTAVKLTSGYSTIKKGVNVLPEYGYLKWINQNLEVKSYKTISNIVFPKISGQELLDETVKDYKAAANYLAHTHKCVIPVSGGIDSRVVLDIFWDVGYEKVQCYTRKDHYRDIKIAKAVVEERGCRHEILKLSPLPSLDDLDIYIKAKQSPFLSYDDVYHYLYSEAKARIYADEFKVEITGKSGNIDRNIAIFNSLNHNLATEDFIAAFLNKIMRNDILLPEAKKMLHQRLYEYYLYKYFYILNDIGKERLSSLFFHFETYRANECRNNIQSQLCFGHDLYVPLANEKLTQAIFKNPVFCIYRNRRESIHHQLEKKLTNDLTKAIPFTTSAHWKTKALHKSFYNVSNRFLLRLHLGRIFDAEKYPDRIRKYYFEINRNSYLDILMSHNNSKIWDYLDKIAVIKYFDTKGNQHNSRDRIKVISQLAAMLNNGML